MMPSRGATDWAIAPIHQLSRKEDLMQHQELYPDATEVDHDVVPGSAEWMAYATGSKVPVIMEVSPWQSRTELWRAMTGIQADGFMGTVYTDHGTEREPIIREQVAAELGTKVEILTPRMLLSQQDPRFAYSPDGILTWEHPYLWECKTTTTKQSAKWGVEGTDEIPDDYRAQVQWGLFVTGLQRCLVTLEVHDDFEPQPLQHYWVERDDSYIGHMVSEVDTFLRHVETRTPPPPLGAVVVDDLDDLDAVRRYVKDQKQANNFAASAKAERAVIDRLAGKTAKALVDPFGEVLVRFSETTKLVETVAVDWAAVEAEHPDAVAAATTVVDYEALRLLVPESVAEHTTITETTTTTRRLLTGQGH